MHQRTLMPTLCQCDQNRAVQTLVPQTQLSRMGTSRAETPKQAPTVRGHHRQMWHPLVIVASCYQPLRRPGTLSFLILSRQAEGPAALRNAPGRMLRRRQKMKALQQKASQKTRTTRVPHRRMYHLRESLSKIPLCQSRRQISSCPYWRTNQTIPGTRLSTADWRRSTSA